MKHSSLVFLYLIFSLQVVSQTKKEQKLLDLYSSQQFDKLAVKAKKFLRKDRNNAYAHYCLSALHFDQAQGKKTPVTKKRHLSKALRYFKKLPEGAFSEYRDSVHYFIREHALDSNLSKDINNQYRHWLLVLFTDSVAQFQITILRPELATLVDSAHQNKVRFTLLKTAQKLEGVPYKYAGTHPEKGLDCSGFTQYVYKSAGIEIPHNSTLQSKLSNERIPLEKLKPGDLVFFGSWNGTQPRVGHTGIIYAREGNNITVIHCVNGGVKIEGKNSSWDRYWINNVLFGISADTLSEL